MVVLKLGLESVANVILRILVEITSSGECFLLGVVVGSLFSLRNSLDRTRLCNKDFTTRSFGYKKTHI